jgi:hypothetical protein
MVYKQGQELLLALALIWQIVCHCIFDNKRKKSANGFGKQRMRLVEE